jgi:phosphotriesterase-related protein
MPSVQTVLGPVDQESLGQVLMHEHLLFALPGWDLDCTLAWNRAAALERIAGELTAARQAGLGSFVDLTAIGVCRDPEFMREVSSRSGVHLLAATGWWIAAGIAQHFQTLTVERLHQIMLREITQGIGSTGVKAGIIKVGTSKDQVLPAEENVLRAAARAQVDTGCLISTHTSVSTMGLEQASILSAEGADLRRVVIGHSDDRIDLDYHRRLLERGVTVQFDHIGSRLVQGVLMESGYVTDEQKVEMLATLIGEGYLSQLTLSHDSVGDLPARPGANETHYCKYTYIFEAFVPRLLRDGVSEEAIRAMLVSNPSRLLPF